MALTPISAEPDVIQELKAQYDQSAFAPVLAPNEIPPGPNRYFGYGLGQVASPGAPAGQSANNLPEWYQTAFPAPSLPTTVAPTPSVFTGAPAAPTPAATAATPEERKALFEQQIAAVPGGRPAHKAKGSSWITPTVVVVGGLAVAGAVWYFFLRKKDRF